MPTIIERTAAMTAEQKARMGRDLAFMQTPGDWPRWPLLPLVQRNGQMSDDKYTALLLATGTPTIYHVNLLALPAWKAGQTWGDVLAGISSRTYPTFEHLAADYRVD